MHISPTGRCIPLYRKTVKKLMQQQIRKQLLPWWIRGKTPFLVWAVTALTHSHRSTGMNIVDPTKMQWATKENPLLTQVSKSGPVQIWSKTNLVKMNSQELLGKDRLENWVAGRSRTLMRRTEGEEVCMKWIGVLAKLLLKRRTFHQIMRLLVIQKSFWPNYASFAFEKSSMTKCDIFRHNFLNLF